eukprot:CAMPEP_0185338170 /NCGR_PEP_ID=MMETSP1363-20130426/94860_1 /TAXON_ID=38817 /ORGANISM="Gephyrocapsa oceanica, Strain RCC1303" /LENGTH=36 /DNA_ID= /DNA_START= /DNA_END= /DNA_ORIENTATION=
MLADDKLMRAIERLRGGGGGGEAVCEVCDEGGGGEG